MPVPCPTLKSFDSYPGLSYVKEVAAEISLPAFAIGGINSENIARVCEAGLHRVAVQSSVTKAGSPAATAVEMIATMIRDSDAD